MKKDMGKTVNEPNKKNKKKKINYRKVVLAIADAFIIGISYVICNFLFGILDKYVEGVVILPNDQLTVLCVISVVTGVLMLFFSGAYSKLWRYFRAKDYLVCLSGTAVMTLVTSVCAYIIFQTLNIPFMFIMFFISTFGIMAFRYIFKQTFLTLAGMDSVEIGKRTLIVGAGEACRIMLKEIENVANDNNNPSKEYNPVCIVDDDVQKQRTSVKGIKVMGSTEDIEYLCKKEKIEIIIFAIPSCPKKERTRILDICSRTGCKIKVIPYVSHLLNYEDDSENPLVKQIKDIKPEDLLGRPPVSFDNEEVKNFIMGKVCMITGGGGSIGSELSRQIAKYMPKQIIIIDSYENNAYEIEQELLMDYGDKLNLKTLIANVQDSPKMREIFEKYHPQIVFHAAAHKHVPLMETSPEEAVKNNVLGTFNTASLAAEYKAQTFVMISTDKAVNPTNVMGATKRVCEMVVQYMSQRHSDTVFITTRFGNVLGSNGSVIPLFRKQLESGKDITVTHPEVIRYFMTIPEAVSLVMQAGAIAKGGEIFVLDMGDPVKIVTLAENLIRMYGKTPYKDVKIRFVGLRPGEKLYEELLMDEEGLKSTSNNKLFIGKQIDIDSDKFAQKLKDLEEVAQTNDSARTIKELEALVPTFKHKNNKSK